MDQTQRATFYQGQYLDAEDFSALAAYPRVQQARHDLGGHTWGIAAGLGLVQRVRANGEVEYTIAPGYAWDGYGRPIVVLAPAKITVDLFAGFQGATNPEGVLIKVWLRYREDEAKPALSGFQPCGDDAHARVVETFSIAVGEPAGGSQGMVSVAGGSHLPAEASSDFDPHAGLLGDHSVPFQRFPEGETPVWLVPLGYVRWQKLANQQGRFLPRNDGGSTKDSDLSRAQRHYIGVVAETIVAADGVIRMRPRNKDLDVQKTHFHPPTLVDDPRNPDDLLWVEGTMRVQGHTRITGGQLQLRTAEGSDQQTPTALQRSGDAGKAPGEVGGRALEAHIGRTGQSGDAASRFTVGPVDPGGVQARVLTVLSTGNVGIGTDTPQEPLDVHGRILRNGQRFTFAGVAADDQLVLVPWGTTDDWRLFVSPREMGEGDDHPITSIVCRAVAQPLDGGYLVTARYSVPNEADPRAGTANYIWVPR